MTTDRKLKVCIVGSGLAGLAAARILREHHDVTVFERGSPDHATGGQGIVFFPSTVKIARRMGYDENRAYPCEDAYFHHYDRYGNDKGNVFSDYENRFGAHTWSGLRSDCRDELFRLATAPAEEVEGMSGGQPVNMVFHTPVVDVDAEKGIVQLKDGSTFQADLVVSKFQPMTT